ncbi:MAG: helix-turn-helix domain-containing protein [Candidatus Symbiothrix sp.]|jgi:ribosome-binding protein aMBF1 (putative translation factor)|nr:helix-turn-helix domain-containing protein [Candidatus Symbiothrix sp.]
METKDIIKEVLSSISFEESNRIEKKMLMASKIDETLKKKGWKKKDLMQAMGKTNQSEITKWLSGTHNFTMDTIVDLERILDIHLLNLEKEQPVMENYYKVNYVSKSPVENFNLYY